MWALFKHDFRQYFNSPLGYVLLGIFFSVNGLFLWIFSGNFNLIEAGFGDLSLFFELNPWLLLVFVPALSMKSFADEIKRGTLEIILTKPIAKTAIIAGKYFAIIALIVLALSIAVFYALLLSPYLLEGHAWDWGIFWGSLTGLFLLAACFAAIGLWASTLVDNAFTAFLIALFVGLFLYYGWAQVATLISDFFLYSQLNYVALQHHYSILGKGVIPFSSVLYFAIHTLLFLYLTFYNLQKRTQ